MSALRDLADTATAYKNQYEAGLMTFEEFQELVEDLHIQDNIDRISSELESDERLHEVLMGVVKLSGILL